MHRVLVLLVVEVLATAVPAAAQVSAEETIRGVVRGEQGGALPGVRVTASNPASARLSNLDTDSEGAFRLVNLPPGPCSLAAELNGFSMLVRPGIELRAGLKGVGDPAATPPRGTRASRG